ncbi:hypothetical protein KC340_g13086 [Hortaea werneckii]|nr:hypothetical protein KC342_g12968 [Hortaea werneckii]KAI7069608.1 hypothetical protein KC339_g14785 [Hortaea werneckii]KAI7241580.1 hypothetical protein KC365_g3501 [Hortaea werneckii]KAI7301319.1 hypothetical protein KC340_g13086 [Hortaea werneckii]KAI7377810.1 hypothetical protein KC328_g14231 [Hortaea werneckii]
MVDEDTCVDQKPAAAPVRLAKLFAELESKSTETVGQAPLRIHVSDVNGHRGPVSYIGSGWYRSVTASEHGKLATRREAPATRKDFYQAVEAYRQRHPDVVAKYYPTPPEDGKEEHACKRRFRERSPEAASTSGPRMPSPQNRVATRSSTRDTAARRRLGRTRETATGQVHVTRLKDYPGAEFTPVGNGWYVQDSSRTGAWVVVPVGTRSPAG